MHIRIDIGDATVMALEMEAVWGDRPVEELVRVARCASAGGAGRRRKNARDLCLEPRGLTVADKRRAGLLHPGLEGKLSLCGCRAGNQGRHAAGRNGAEKAP